MGLGKLKWRRSYPQVYYLEDLLAEVLADEQVRHDIVQEVCRADQVSAIAEELASSNVGTRNTVPRVSGVTDQERSGDTASTSTW